MGQNVASGSGMDIKLDVESIGVDLWLIRHSEYRLKPNAFLPYIYTKTKDLQFLPKITYM